MIELYKLAIWVTGLAIVAAIGRFVYRAGSDSVIVKKKKEQEKSRDEVNKIKDRVHNDDDFRQRVRARYERDD
jgi:hypothetical protein